VAAIVHTIVACEQDTNASERTVTYVIAMMGIKLNAQVMLKNLRVQSMHENLKSQAQAIPPTGARALNF
jgi:hypothetical protein